MRVRFGYVAIAMDLENCSPSKTVTATNLSKIDDIEARLIKLRKAAKENIHNTMRILIYNSAHDIEIYRLTSKLVPLATHSIAGEWNYIEDLKDDLYELGKYVKDNGLRVSSHPDHFTLLNSPKDDVLNASLKDIQYHERIFDAMGLDSSAKMVLHIGGLYGEKEASIERFNKNFSGLWEKAKQRIILENDDKIYSTEDVLDICKKLSVPMVLDIHHDRCNPSSKDIKEYIEPIFSTWRGQALPPKIHLSSPKSEKDFRSHADYIDPNDFTDFLIKAKEVDMDFDVMIEAKQKDRALHKLMEDLKGIGGIKIINGAEIEF